MAMELTFLGTASAYPTPTRGVSCTILRHDGTYWMFDCGESSQIQLMRSHIRPGKISKIFISHLHGDHAFGLPGLLCTISQKFSPDSRDAVQLYGPLGLRKFIRVCLQLSRSEIGFNYCVHELVPLSSQYPKGWDFWKVNHEAEGPLHPNEMPGQRIVADEKGIYDLCSDDKLVVRAGPLVHRVPSFGFVVDEKPMAGKLDATKLKALGIQPGPLYGKIKSGLTITSPDGQAVRPEDVVGPERPGRKVVILGDTRDSSALTVIARGANMLVHETTLENAMAAKCKDRGHSTPEMAAKFALSIEAKHLTIFHVSQRYRPLGYTKPENSENKALATEEEDTIQKLLDETREVFGEHVTAAEDLLTVPVK